MKSKKRVLVIIGIVFAILLIVCTIISNMIYSKNLPIVYAVQDSSLAGTITKTLAVEGENTYTNLREITASNDYLITDVYCETGDNVKKGDLLARGISLPSAYDEDAEAEYVDIKAPNNGKIVSLNVAKNIACSARDILFKMTTKYSKRCVKWAHPSGEEDFLDEKTLVAYSYAYVEENETVKIYQGSTQVGAILDTAMSKSVISYLEDDSPSTDGICRAEINLIKKADQEGFVVPKSAIYNIGNQKAVYVVNEVETAFGIKMRAMASVIEVIDESEAEALIKGTDIGKGYMVIISADKPLADQIEVKRLG